MPAGTVTFDNFHITVGLMQQAVAASALLGKHEHLYCQCSGTLPNTQDLCQIVFMKLVLIEMSFSQMGRMFSELVKIYM